MSIQEARQVYSSRFPDWKGRLVLQDLLPVIADTGDLHGGTVRQEYDSFFVDSVFFPSCVVSIKRCKSQHSSPWNR